MFTAKERNEAFSKLVKDTANMPFKARLMELRAFALGAGCRCVFDSTRFELWSRNRMLYRANSGC